MKKTKLSFTFVLFVFLSSFFMIGVKGAAATELSNPSRTPSLEGAVDYDYESDYRCDYVLKTEFPELTVLLFRLYYRMNAGSWNYASMSVLDSNTYKKDNFSPDDMGAIGGDEIDYYFYIKDSDSPAGEDTTATYSFTVNPDITPPAISNVVDDNEYNEPDNLVQFNATITDASGISTATLYWSSDKITWTQESMSNIAGDIWSWTSSANDFSVGTLYYFVKAVDPSDNVMFSDSWSYDGSGNYYDWEEGSYEGWSTHSSYGSSSLTSTGEYKIDRDDAVDPNPHAAAWRIGFFSILNQSDYSVMVTRFKLESNGGYDDDEYIYYKSAGSFGITNSGTKSASYYADNIDSNAWHESVVYVADDSDWHDATSTLYLMMDSMNVSDSNQMYFNYCHILWARNFTVYDWDSPAVGTPTHVPSSNIENDDTVTVSSTITDEDSDVSQAGIYYFDGTSWSTSVMSEGASNVWSGDIPAQTYDETIDYTVWGVDDYNNQGFNGQSNAVQHDFNENIHNFFKVIGYGSFTHDEDDGWGYQAYNNEASGGYINIRRTGYSINTANYRMFFIKWKTNTAYDQKFYGIRDGSQYISLYSWSDNYYTNYDNINSSDGWIITYGYFDSDFYDTETTLDFVWTPSNYPNQDTTTADYIYVDWIHLVYPKSYPIVDVTAPSLSNPSHSPTNPDETDAITLSVDVSDGASGVDEVKCYWRVNAGGWNNHLMSGSGTYNYEIGLFDIDDNLEYYFWVNDSDGNDATLENGGSYYTISVTDQENPVLNTPEHLPVNPNDDDSVTFRVVATDNGNLDTVLVYVKINAGSWVSYEMSVGSGSYQYVYGTFSVNDEIDYYFYANDTAANSFTLNNSGSYYEFTVGDDINPVISNEAQDPLSNNVEYGDTVDFIAIITDNYDVQSARLYYKINSGEWNYLVMDEGGMFDPDNSWIKSLSGFDYGVTVYWYIWSEDYHSNTETTSTYDFYVDDFTDPVLSNPTNSPEIPEPDEDVTLSITVIDNVDVTLVKCKYYIDGAGYGEEWVTLSEGESNVWSVNIGQFNHSQTITYFFSAWDQKGNVDNTNNYEFSTVDGTNPVVSDLSHFPEVVDCPVNQNFTVTVTDNGVLSTVKLYWSITPGSWSDSSMSVLYGDVYNVVLDVFDIPNTALGDRYYFYVDAVDTASNNKSLDGGSFDVVDVTTPFLVSCVYPETFGYDTGNYTLYVIVTDIFPEYYTLFKDGVQWRINNFTSGVVIDIDLHWLAVGFYSFVFKAYDTSNNYVSDSFTVDIFDKQEPIIVIIDDSAYLDLTNPVVDIGLGAIAMALSIAWARRIVNKKKGKKIKREE